MKIRASGIRGHEAELLRVRGAARLLGRSADPDRTGRDREAALEIAGEQGARAFELRSALSLTKLYRSTGCPLKAQALLVGAIEGFLPTPKFSEIAKARTLLGALA